uniref:Platelet-derived growth factor (PDGF) family profile domain-containing protein n=1 Tax=Daphnia galeata TaxID=27404 RepID=A0A8J2WCR2_9CRUS|nr:unnamed protein product [Daphnia galeata]
MLFKSPYSVLFHFTSVVFLLLTGGPFDTPEAKNVMVTFKRNIDQVLKEWNCNKPQMRLVYLEDEYVDYNPSAIYLPHAAVVHRCDKSIGCCKTGHVCATAEEEDMTFIVEEFLRGRKMKKEVQLSNHVRCECQSLTQERK